MPGVTRSLRMGTLLVALAGLVAAGLESVSFSHEHLADGLAHRHHHVFFGPHEHPEPEPDHHDDEAPASRKPQKSATVSLALSLLQPVAVRVLAAPPPRLVLVAAAPALRRVVQPAARPASPRGPPSSLALPTS